MELAAQHLLGLRELGRAIASGMTEGLAELVCSNAQEDQVRPLIQEVNGPPENDVTLP